MHCAQKLKDDEFVDNICFMLEIKINAKQNKIKGFLTFLEHNWTPLMEFYIFQKF